MVNQETKKSQRTASPARCLFHYTKATSRQQSIKDGAYAISALRRRVVYKFVSNYQEEAAAGQSKSRLMYLAYIFAQGFTCMRRHYIVFGSAFCLLGFTQGTTGE